MPQTAFAATPPLASSPLPSETGQEPWDGDRLSSPNAEAIVQVASQVVAIDKAQRMAEVFALLGDPNRLRILSALAVCELCVCDLAAAVTMSESAVSHQLRALRSQRLVGYRKQGRHVYYRLKDSHVLALYQQVSEHLDEPED